MRCTSCKYPDSRVVRTWDHSAEDKRIRRHECLRCGTRFTTEEHLKEPKKLHDKPN